MKHVNPALETKNAQEVDGKDPVMQALDGLTTEFGDFQKKQDTRFTDLEQKTIAKVVERIDKLEAKVQRPGAAAPASKEEALILERKALNTFLRFGPAALDDMERKTLNLTTPAAGGYVVAPEYSTQIIEAITEFSPMRALASIMGVGTTEVYLPVITGKIAGGWVTETGARPSSEPVFDQLNIKTFEHAVIVPISVQLLEDAMIDLSAYISGQIGQQFGKAESAAFVTGDGNGKPTGFLYSPADYQQVSAAQDGSDIIERIIELYYKLPTAYAARGAWQMNRKTMGIIRAAADTTTKGTLWSDGLANGQPATLLGRPVREAVDMEDLQHGGSPTEDTYPIAFGDFASAYRIVDRVGVQIMRDDYTGADNGIVKIRARRRVGGKKVQSEAIVLLKGAA
ncbi:MAG: phage major capsid protein [Pseudorhodoplanes sp.]|jgi:HK97 family phage major capsid protein|nr:phage major capsid protein [Pseudorhodoplanes sp.]